QRKLSAFVKLSHSCSSTFPILVRSDVAVHNVASSNISVFIFYFTVAQKRPFYNPWKENIQTTARIQLRNLSNLRLFSLYIRIFHLNVSKLLLLRFYSLHQRYLAQSRSELARLIHFMSPFFPTSYVQPISNFYKFDKIRLYTFPT
ncbi:hypothetical protein L9F63_021308, partial [Diploptera punctata]